MADYTAPLLWAPVDIGTQGVADGVAQGLWSGSRSGLIGAADAATLSGMETWLAAVLPTGETVVGVYYYLRRRYSMGGRGL